MPVQQEQEQEQEVPRKGSDSGSPPRMISETALHNANHLAIYCGIWPHIVCLWQPWKFQKTIYVQQISFWVIAEKIIGPKKARVSKKYLATY